MALINKLGKLLQTDSIANSSHGVVGIDVGASSLKMVQLKMGEHTVAVETYGEIQLAPYAGEDLGKSVKLEGQRLSEALVDLVREAGITSRVASLAIPSHMSFMSTIEVPTTDKHQLAAMVQVEARKYIPVPLTDVTLDWFEIPAPAAQANAATRVLLAAIHNESYTQFRSSFQNAGLLGKWAEIESFSTVRSAVTQSNATTLVIDFGAASTRLYIIESGVVHDTHTVRGGGVELTMAVSKAYQKPFAEAEELKRAYGLTAMPDGNDLRPILTPQLERVCGEIIRMITRFEQVSGVHIESAVLTGGGALLPNIAPFVGQRLGKKIQFADPFAKVEYPAFLENTLREAGPSFSVALGAALRGMSEQ